jgi:hypothetical protein
MSWHTVHLADVPPSPWKNGGGTTRELLAWPSAQGLGLAHVGGRGGEQRPVFGI